MKKVLHTKCVDFDQTSMTPRFPHFHCHYFGFVNTSKYLPLLDTDAGSSLQHRKQNRYIHLPGVSDILLHCHKILKDVFITLVDEI